MLGVAGCSADEDENDLLDDYSITKTNDGTLSDEDGNYVTYARSWNVTKTKHLSANATMTIDLTTEVEASDGTKSKTTTNNNNGGTGNDAAYIFGLDGEGNAKNPYSFFLLGFRVYKTTPQYFISYYTGVQSSYCNSDADDFDVDDSSNNAYEYVAVKAWTDIPSGSYTLTNDALTVYIEMDAIANDDTIITSSNYSNYKGNIDGYKIILRASSDATSGTLKDLRYSNFTAQSYTNKTANTLTTFNIDQTYLGFYAMISKGSTLVAKLEFDNDSIVKSAYAGPVDNFGNTIDLNGEVLKNF